MTKPRVVADTNIIISAIFWKGKPYEYMLSALQGKCQLVLSEQILTEVTDKLKNRFNVPQDKIDDYKRILLTHSKLVNPKTEIRRVKSDPGDNKILECAIAGEADYVVTGDKHLLEIKEYSGVRIINVHEMLSLM